VANFQLILGFKVLYKVIYNVGGGPLAALCLIWSYQEKLRLRSEH